MLILTVRTDKLESELGLYEDERRIDYITWDGHRKLVETIHHQLKDLLDNNKLKLDDLKGIVIYKGPGSFTGLRIGCSVGNALADSFGIPIVGENGADWQGVGIKRIKVGKNELPVVPDYGGEVFTTKPVK